MMKFTQITLAFALTFFVLLAGYQWVEGHEGHDYDNPHVGKQQSQPVVVAVNARQVAPQTTQPASPPPLRWYKGNTHAHTTIGDGDSTPEEVTAWYHERGYNFLCLSEHNRFIDPATVPMPEKKRDDFILIPGEEITGAKTIHTTALNVKSLVDWKFKSENKSEIIQNHVDGAYAAQGIPILNHPNFRRAVTALDMLPVKRLHLFELYNGHPGVLNWGDEKTISTEQLWDTLLTAGMLIYAVSSDDAHFWKKWGPQVSNPGRGFIMVRAAELTPDAITHAVHHGDFYSSSGVILSEVSAANGIYRVTINETETQHELESPFLVGRHRETGEAGYRIDFIGPPGNVLQSTAGTQAEFKLNPQIAYIRCKVTYTRRAEEGVEEFAAWTQPAFNDDRATRAHITNSAK